MDIRKMVLNGTSEEALRKKFEDELRQAKVEKKNNDDRVDARRDFVEATYRYLTSLGMPVMENKQETLKIINEIISESEQELKNIVSLAEEATEALKDKREDSIDKAIREFLKGIM